MQLEAYPQNPHHFYQSVFVSKTPQNQSLEQVQKHLEER